MGKTTFSRRGVHTRMTQREREQHEEMRQRKIRASLVANFPHNRLCDACRARDPWIDICPQCRANAEAYADGRSS